MAIKRTITRRYGVRPVQMDVSSGALSLAKATETVANTVSNVTKFIDDNQFQEAVLNAEIQGRRVGSQTITDKNGNTIPKPLDQMTLNSFTADIYNKANIRKAQQYFKKEAINSYGLALQNHAIDVASKSFLENGGKVNEQGKLIVQNAGDSYIDGIKKQERAMQLVKAAREKLPEAAKLSKKAEKKHAKAKDMLTELEAWQPEESK